VAVQDPLATRPKTVVLLAHGGSLYRYFYDVIATAGVVPWDEIWCINLIARAVRHDKHFMMDDLRYQVAELYPKFAAELKTTDRPIITSQAYPEFPTSVSFPIKQVVNVLRDDWFENTACYAIGYALAIGVKELWLYGCDFYYENVQAREAGGQNAAHLIGLARQFGCTVKIPRESTLLSMHKIEPDGNGDYVRPLYGYRVQPDLNALPDWANGKTVFEPEITNDIIDIEETNASDI